jgi:hypothetical protein
MGQLQSVILALVDLKVAGCGVGKVVDPSGYMAY